MKVDERVGDVVTTSEVENEPSLPILTEVRRYNPRKFFLKLKVLVGEF